MAKSEAKKANGGEHPEAKPREIIPVGRANPEWMLEDHATNRFRLMVGEDIELADLENPKTFSVVSSELKAFDRITVIRKDGAFWAEVLIVNAGRGFADGVILRSLAPIPKGRDETANRVPDGYTIARDPTTLRYIARRTADNARMNGDGDLSYEDALRSLLDHATIRAPHHGPRYG